MTTTIVRDSIVGDAWINAAIAACPPQWIIDQKTGERSGDILTGPVRIAFDDLFELPKIVPGKVDNPKFGSMALFPPGVDMAVFYEAYYAVCAREFADKYDAGSGQYYGLHSPFRDQGEKLKFGGFTPGCTFLNCTSKFQPSVIDQNFNPIIDRKRVYPGVWAMFAVNAYAFKDVRKSGVAFGLQSVMIIGDDTKLGGGAPDPRQSFGGAAGAIVPPTISGQHAAGMPRPAGPPGAPQPGLPSAPPGGTYAAPPPPAAGHYAPPPAAAPGGYSMPGMAQGRGPVPDGFDSWAEYDELMG